jgi:hypothetical protein
MLVDFLRQAAGPTPVMYPRVIIFETEKQQHVLYFMSPVSSRVHSSLGNRMAGDFFFRLPAVTRPESFLSSQ